MIKVKIALALLIGVLINSSCSKTSIEDICSNMNTYEGNYNWQTQLFNNRYELQSYGKTKDGITIKEKHKFKIERNGEMFLYLSFDNLQIWYKSDSVLSVPSLILTNDCCDRQTFSLQSLENNKLKLSFSGGPTCEKLCNTNYNFNIKELTALSGLMGEG